jgi:hypothetical protein
MYFYLRNNIYPMYVTESNLYFDISSAKVLSEPSRHRFLTFHVQNLTSIFFLSGRLSIESVQVRAPLWRFVTSLYFMVRSFSPTPYPEAGGPPLVGCLRLLLSFIYGGRFLHPQLEKSTILLWQVTHLTWQNTK